MPYRPGAAGSNNATPLGLSRARVTNTPDEEGDDGGTNPSSVLRFDRTPASSRPDLTDREVAEDQLPTMKSSDLPAHSASTSQRGHQSSLNQGQNASSRPNFTSRRRQSSIPKIPMGPRPLDYGAGKRSVSNSVVHQFNNVRGASAVASQDPNTFELSINDISRFSFASIAPPQPQLQRPSHDGSEASFEFGNFLEPTFNFDDFHDHITTTNPDLNSFPVPGRGPIQHSETPDPPPSQPPQAPIAQPAIPIPARKASAMTATVSRKPSTASTTSRASTKSDTMAAAATQTQPILRGRRQSHFPPNAFNNNGTKAPRKSIGPGTFVAPEQDKTENVKRRPSVGGRKSSNENKSGLSLRLIGRKKENSNDGTKSPRTIKAKSFLAPKSQSSNELLTPSRTPDPARPTSSHVPNTPKTTGTTGTPGRTTTPGAASRRMSVMPNHASGLGARTISPTDARRMKRMSMVPPAPPLPQSRISQAPPTPQPDPASHPSATAQSPAASNRKSMTPSSSRTTPDPNRKSYSSGQSMSSATSYNSVRNSVSMNARLSQAINSSRLPTPKPKIDTSGTQTHQEGEVPPVPAIPKAYESPGSEMDQPYFSARSSSLPPVDTPISASPLVTTFADAMKAIDTPRAPSSSSRIANFQAETEPRQKTQPKPINKNDKSLRLPPLNLLPLSTPTAAKIKAFKESRIEAQDLPSTPLGTRNTMKTPSTPMTASKASFFSRNNKNADDSKMRSSTSHHALRPDPLLSSGEDSPSLPMFNFENELFGQDRNISPFISSSLPKTDDFSTYMRPNFTTELNRTTGPRPAGPRAPSFSLTPKMNVTESPVERGSDSESAFSASALRKKLSRKKSEPLVAATAQTEDLSKYDNMPPPKLPASATWSNNLSSATTHQQKPPSYIRSRRQASTSSIRLGPERQESFDSSVTHVSAGRPSLESTRSFMSNSNRSGSGSQNLSAIAKPPINKHHELPLDRDDMVAEEEMKKLAMKRRDFESAARQLDNLRARACPARRMSSATASHVHNLNIFERGEVVDYPDVYFIGTKNARKIVGDPNQASVNFGYDDDRGDYNIIEGDHLAYRYEVVDVLGKGSFGQVVRCVDHLTGILVAVKIIRNKKRFHQQALVEVNILQKLKEWDPHKKHSVVDFDQSFYFRGHLCISTDLLGMNLYEFIKAHDFRGFSLKLIRRFTKQLLNSLILLHNHKVIHCDLKPENILLAHPMHSEIKVIDFGSSCFENEKVYTYIQSRFYRSPEVILGMSYGMPIDMWSVGCILAELFTGYPIFPGENEQEQLACIMEVFGPPEKHLIEKSSRKKLFFDSMGKPRLTVSSKGRRRRPSSKDLRQALKCDDEAFLDFIARCLRWDPARRMSPHEANKHEFITGVKMAPSTSRRTATNNVNSPIKRINSINALGGARPLPVPPSSTLRVNTARQDANAISPSKAVPRRQSNANALQVGSQAKRASHATTSSSASNPNLTRLGMGQRNMSARSDLATAAATASLVK